MNIEKYIDHTFLKSDASYSDIKKLCNEAIKYDFYSVCINPYFVKMAKRLLENSNVKVCTVIGFPLGANIISTKIFETNQAILDGVDEIDMVMNITEFKEKNYNFIKEEINCIKKECGDKILKVIIETCALTKDEIIKACEIVDNTDANFIKTSTGFGKYGANYEDVKLMLDNVKNISVKASGGISDGKIAKEYINMGVKRIGTSNGVKIIENIIGSTDY